MSDKMLTFKERPILFRGEMVRAILAGDKTQTRRVVKGPVCVDDEAYRYDPNMVWFGAYGTRKGCPYGKVGDRLWVRETWTTDYPEKLKLEVWEGGQNPDWIIHRAQADDVHEGIGIRWRPSIHMPRWACRIRLEITNIRIERLQAISRGEAMAEGCPFANMAKGPDPREWFRELWERVNGAGAWDANWFVWVVEFKVLEGRAA